MDDTIIYGWGGGYIISKGYRNNECYITGYSGSLLVICNDDDGCDTPAAAAA